MNFVRLVKDDYKFNDYPWDAYLYKLIVQSLKEIFFRSNLDELSNPSCIRDIKGFFLAFQVTYMDFYVSLYIFI